MKLAIIPARGGSKRIPGKNIRSFFGQPIIGYSIEAAIKSQIFDEVMVSTDDEEVSNIAKHFGAKTPFMRSASNSDDHATLADVVSEVLNCYYQKGIDIECFSCLLPTAPFISAAVIKEGYDKMESGDLESIFTAVRYSYPIQRSLKLLEGGLSVEMVDKRYMNTRSQDLEPRFHDAGQMYLVKTSAFREQETFFTKKSGIIERQELLVQDIDSENDWMLAEVKYQAAKDRGLF